MIWTFIILHGIYMYVFPLLYIVMPLNVSHASIPLTKCFIKLSPFCNIFFIHLYMEVQSTPNECHLTGSWIAIFPIYLLYLFCFTNFFFFFVLDAQRNPLYHAWNYVTDYKFYFYFRLLFLMWIFQFKKIN